MDTMDQDVERQVWQRVLASRQEPPRDDLRAVMLAAMELAAVYRHLALQLTGRPKEHAKRLYQGEMDNIACLKGMEVLSGRAAEKPKAFPAPKEPPGKLLEKCYHRTRRCLTEYTARTVDGEFGSVFQKMANRESEHCAAIVELLGTL